LVPLDIVWIDKNRGSKTNIIVAIAHDALPCKENVIIPCPIFNPGVNAKYVVEINSNLTQEYGINLGDEVEIN